MHSELSLPISETFGLWLVRAAARMSREIRVIGGLFPIAL